MKKLKSLLSDTLVYGISSVFARFINYLLVPLYTDVFDPDQYSVVSLVYVAIALFNVILTMGMESAYLRYAKDRDKAPTLFSTLQLFLLISSIVLLGATYMAQPLISPQLGLDSGSPIFLMMLGILFFDTCTIVPFAELRLIGKSWLFAGLRTVNVFINLGLNIYLILGLGYGIEAIFISNLVASVLTAILVWASTLHLWTLRINLPDLKTALRFGLPFIPAGLGYVVNEMIDRFFLKNMSSEHIQALYEPDYSGDDLVGIYSACYKLSVFMLLFVQMYRMAWQPFFINQSDDTEATQLFSKAFDVFNYVAAIIFLSVSLFIYDIVQIKIPLLDAYLIGEQYWAGLNVVPILLGAYWFQGWYVNFSAGIFIKEKTKYLARITIIGAVITITLNIFLVPLLGMLGSALATLVSYASMAIIIYYHSRKALEVPYHIFRNFGLILLSFLAVYMYQYFDVPLFSSIPGNWSIYVLTLIIISILSIPHLLKTNNK